MSALDPVEKKRPELPAAYELIVLDCIDSLRSTVATLARGGAGEGTLIWAHQQSHLRGRLEKKWNGDREGLHCTILLRPEFPVERYGQMLIVATVSLGNAIAVHLTPMIALHYRWPNDITIGDHKIAGLWLDSETGESPWLSITCSVNIIHPPQDFGIPAISINEVEGETALSAAVLLETYAREFISQINNWSERGFDYTLNLWKARFDQIAKPVHLRIGDESIEGKVKAIDKDGGLTVATDDSSERKIPIEEYMELKPT